MTFQWNHVTTEAWENAHATSDDFCRVFTEDMDDLYQLAFVLTCDPANAERCFVAGVEDCLASNHVFRGWARSWAKRTIVRRAIRLLQPQPKHKTSSGNSISRKRAEMVIAPAGDFDRDKVLALGDFERFVFALSILEKYSSYECAILLDCSVPDVRDAQERALRQFASQDQSASSRKLITEKVHEMEK